MTMLQATALFHAMFVLGLSVVVVLRYLLSPRRWHIVGMAVSYIGLTLVNVDNTVHMILPVWLKFHISVWAWVIGDVCLLLLLGRARSALDGLRRRRGKP